MINVRKQTGLKIKAMRLSLGMSQEQFAEKIGINSQQLSRIECGKSYLTYKVLEALCDTFDKEPQYFFTYREIVPVKNDIERINLINNLMQELDSEEIIYIEKIVRAFAQ